MRTKAILIYILTVSIYSTASVTKETSSSSSSKSAKDMNPAQEDSILVPVSISLSKSPFDIYFRNRVLAPVQGTELALDLSQSQFKYSSNFESGKSAGKSDYTTGTLSIAHAFSSDFFVGANLSYGQSKGDSSWTDTENAVTFGSASKSSGVSDPTLTAGGRIVGEKSAMIMSVSAKIKSGASEDKTSVDLISETNVSESNFKSGGSSLIPSITLHTKILENSLIGTALSYVIMFEKESNYTSASGYSSKSRTTGGNVQNLSVFLETSHRNLSYGGSIDYSKSESGRTKEDHGEFSYESESSSVAFTTITGFINLKIKDQLSLIPSVSYGQLGEGAGRMDTKDLFAGSVLARTRF